LIYRMSVATAVEVRTGGVAEPAPILRAGWNFGRGGAGEIGDGSATVTGAQSFRSNWQTQVAALGSGAGEADIAENGAEPDASKGAVFNGLASSASRMPEPRKAGLLQTNSIATSGVIQQRSMSGSVGVESQGPAAPIKERARESGPVARPERSSKVENDKSHVATGPGETILANHDFVLSAVPVQVPVAPVVDRLARPFDKGASLVHSQLDQPETALHFPTSGVGGNEKSPGAGEVAAPRLSAPQSSDAHADAKSELDDSHAASGGNSAGDSDSSTPSVTSLIAGPNDGRINQTSLSNAAGADTRTAGNAEQTGASGLPAESAGPVRETSQGNNAQVAADAQGAAQLSSALIAGDARLPAGISSVALSSKRVTREVGAVGLVEHGASQTPGQFVAGPASAMHDPQGALRGDAGAVGTTGNGTTVPALRETFSALDAEAAPGVPAWTHATGRQVEAGFQDPALGWIGVRADLSGGGVHASLMPDSAAAAQELGRHLDGLNAYLAEQHTPVASLEMAAPSGRGADSSAGDGFGQGTQQGTQQGTGQNAQQHINAEQQRERGINGASSDSVTLAQSSGASGAHISVMA
jgi:hypothetical protein